MLMRPLEALLLTIVYASEIDILLVVVVDVVDAIDTLRLGLIGRVRNIDPSTFGRSFVNGLGLDFLNLLVCIKLTTLGVEEEKPMGIVDLVVKNRRLSISVRLMRS